MQANLWAIIGKPGKPIFSGPPRRCSRSRLSSLCGNHEECNRAGAGYLRLLGPRPSSDVCAGHMPLQRLTLGDLALAVLDSADAEDTKIDPKKTPAYRADLAALMQPSAMPVWLLTHRPLWAAISGPLDIPIGGNVQMIAAAEDIAIQKPVSLMLSGHIHAFQQ